MEVKIRMRKERGFFKVLVSLQTASPLILKSTRNTIGFFAAFSFYFSLSFPSPLPPSFLSLLLFDSIQNWVRRALRFIPSVAHLWNSLGKLQVNEPGLKCPGIVSAFQMYTPSVPSISPVFEPSHTFYCPLTIPKRILQICLCYFWIPCLNSLLSTLSPFFPMT